MTGTVFGIGVGPGDPELLTLKAVRLLRQVSVVAYPAPLSGDSLARRIAADHLPAGAVEIALRMPFDPARRADDVYDAGAEEIARHLTAGRDVAVLCEGDPLFFGSFVYLFARLAGRFPVEVVPGVSSLSACAAVLGHPLTARDDALVVIPAPRPEAEIERLLTGVEAAAIMKPGRHLPKVWRVLTRLGLAQNAVYVERAGQAGQRIRPLAEAANDPNAPYFAMILVHRRGKAWN
ncbi:precorrin-2 C(20)-methyltransferase [Telmatospirillum sp.]|uniref:precorrin-2 C(20)-methyltransferase n=1 Tax=Telmatospirillum sp. TaxID=2079197 RepID=UPI00284AD5B7|nr:precorrin-2 C(20)-methyltransferase [Telmatospirillum sp.]MDR3437563.1 precorrin-2 C(20)-methyltransferase [Telmatospirillum sp.]